MRLRTVARTFCLIVAAVLGGALAAWTLAAPLLWVLRDGLGPDAESTVGARAVSKFAVGWGFPASALAAGLAGAVGLERLLARGGRG